MKMKYLLLALSLLISTTGYSQTACLYTAINQAQRMFFSQYGVKQGFAAGCLVVQADTGIVYEWDGSAYHAVGPSSSSGITSLNSQTGATQIFSNDANLVITSSNNTHSLGWASTLSVSRGGSGAALSPALGDIVYSDASKLVLLAAGTSGLFLKSNGAAAPSWATATSSPGGSDTQVQFNNSGSFAGNAGFVFNVGTQSVAIGSGSTATGASSFAQGDNCVASADRSTAEGNTTQATQNNAHSEGLNTIASGFHSHAEGNGTQAQGAESHAEGQSTIASSDDGHAEGIQSTASGDPSHAEGSLTVAQGQNSHAEGSTSTASGFASHSEGQTTVASGDHSLSQGLGTLAQAFNQVAIGQYNIGQGTGNSFVSGDSALIIGNGASSGARANAFAVLNTGEARYYGSTSGYVGLVSPAAPTSHTITLPAGAGAAGSVLYFSGTDVLSVLAPGTAGQVLTSNGAGAPTWQ
jgi:hypothetical protein